jgi:RNA polymerase sigma factor (sigma-70 family)
VATRQEPLIEWNWDALRAQSLSEAQRVLGRTSEAEDAAQEAITRAWLKRDACTEADRPGPWVRTIARREALRIAGQRREAPLDDAVEPLYADEELRLERDAVRAAVRELAEDDRRLLLATYWEDLTGAEVSHRLGCPEATVRVRLHRTRARLRDALGAPPPLRLDERRAA